MKITKLHIQNFKGLRDVEFPLSEFACLIGENNSGKSSVLQALALFFTGTPLPKTHYFADSHNVRIELTLNDITQTDIDRLSEEHRDRIVGIVNKGALCLVRLYGLDGKSTLKYRKLSPTDARFTDGNISELLKGKKAGKNLVEAVLSQFPELNGVAAESMNQGEMRTRIQELADSLPEDQKSPVDADLPTGIDKSIYAMLPDTIYIPAVKDLKDDVKTAESAPFGRVLSILLKAIEPLLAQEQNLFDRLNAKLNRVTAQNGTVRDERLEPVKIIEATVERFVQESFRAVTLQITIPPPDLKTVLSSALIYANDGVDGLIDTKGDGLRRAIIFAILRAYLELSKSGVISASPSPNAADPRYLLLFEEPELYLYPKAQQVLFDALGVFSQRHPVVVTTHSPLFFGPQSTTVFIKMTKRLDASVAAKPFGTTRHIDLGQINARDQFQIICYENNNIAFFAETVVLVEGDSDYIVLPHIARMLDPRWDCGRLPVQFARIGGKGNIGRYRDFFRRFGTRVLVIADLDLLLGNEFFQIDPSQSLREERNHLLTALDAVIDANGEIAEPKAERVRWAQERVELRELWKDASRLGAEYRQGKATMEAVDAAVEKFFSWEKYWPRRDVLRTYPNVALMAQKHSLLQNLRAEGVLILEKGTIENYYPPGVVGDGKPAKAQAFCNIVKTRDHALSLCADGHLDSTGAPVSEFEAICRAIFAS